MKQISKLFIILLLIISNARATQDSTGGDITYYGGYTIHTFNSNGTFTAGSNLNAEVLVVGGGGAGGSTIGGGGGGVSFDGSIVDMNGSTLTNGTFNGTENQNLSQVLDIGNVSNQDIIMNYTGLINTTGFTVGTNNDYYGFTNHYGSFLDGNFANARVNNVTYFFLFVNRWWDTPTSTLKNGTFEKAYGGSLILSGGLTGSAMNFVKTLPNSTTQEYEWTVNNDGNSTQDGTIQADSLVGVGNRPLCASPEGKVIVCP